MPNDTANIHGYGTGDDRALQPDVRAVAPVAAGYGQPGAPRAAAVQPGQQPHAQPQPLQHGQAPYTQQRYGYGYARAPVPGYAQGVFAGQGAYATPATSMPQQLPQKKSKRGLIIAIIIIVCALVVAGIIAFNMIFAPQSTRSGSLGQLEGKTAEEIQAELNRVVDEGMFSISIASYVEFPDGESEGELKIENVPGNRYLMQVDIAREDTNEVVYTSGILDPNHHIQWDALDVDLPAGTYNCVATFHALDPDTESEIGTAGAKLTIAVLQ